MADTAERSRGQAHVQAEAGRTPRPAAVSTARPPRHTDQALCSPSCLHHGEQPPKRVFR